MSPSCTDDDGAISAAQEDDGPPPLRSVLTRRVALPIGIYAALGFIDIAYMALFPLFCATPLALGGLGFGPPRIGAALGAFGLSDGLFQLLVFPRAVDRLGVKRVLQFSLSMFVPIYALFPAMSLYARAYGADAPGVYALIGLQFFLACVMDMSYGTSRSMYGVLCEWRLMWGAWQVLSSWSFGRRRQITARWAR